MRLARFLIALTALPLFAGSLHAQAYLADNPGPFAAVTPVGSPFIIGIEDTAFGATLGYRFAGRRELALRMERAPTRAYGEPGTFAAFEIPGRTFIGLEAAATRGSDRAPWRLTALAGATWSDRGDRIYYADGTRGFEEGHSVRHLGATVSAVKLRQISGGPARLYLGAGPFAEVRHLPPSRTISRAGSPEEEVSVGDAATEWPLGLMFMAPLAVRVGPTSHLVVEPSFRVDILTSLYAALPIPYPQVTVRLDL